MRKFFKKLKNRKGFTLVELMMVVAVIGILAAVLIPKMTGARDNARLTGVEANANQVQAHVESLISRYRGTSESGYGASAFQDALVKSINKSANSTVADEDDISNPFVAGKFGAKEIGSFDEATADDFDAAVAVDVATAADDDNAKGDNAAGLIFVQVIEKGLSDDKKAIENVVITPYDGDGNAMEDKKVTIKP